MRRIIFDRAKKDMSVSICGRRRYPGFSSAAAFLRSFRDERGSGAQDPSASGGEQFVTTKAQMQALINKNPSKPLMIWPMQKSTAISSSASPMRP